MKTPQEMFDSVKARIPSDCLAVNLYHRASTYFHETSVAFHTDLFMASAAIAAAHMTGDCIWLASFTRESASEDWNGYTQIHEPPRLPARER